MQSGVHREALQSRSRFDPARQLPVGLAVMSAVIVTIGSVGPWIHWERHSPTAPAAWTEYGFTSSGIFSLIFAVAATVTLILTFRNEDSAFLAWVAFALLVLCAATGLFEWLTIADMPESPSPTRTEMRPGWGMITVGLAGLVGAGASFIAARTLDDV